MRPTKVFRQADDDERMALESVSQALAALPADADGNVIQDTMLDVARHIPRFQDEKKKGPDGGPGVSVSFFQMIYEVLLGQEKGPRFGSFVALYGISETRQLISDALDGKLA